MEFVKSKRSPFDYGNYTPLFISEQGITFLEMWRNRSAMTP